MKEVFSTLGVSGVWIIEKESGIPLVCYEPMSKIPGVLFGGLLTAIRGMMYQIQIGQLSSISTDKYNLTITMSDNIISAIILEKGFSTDYLYPLLVRINEEAEEKYLDMMGEYGYIETSYFSDFHKRIAEMLVSHVVYMKESSDEDRKRKEPDKADKKLEESGLW